MPGHVTKTMLPETTIGTPNGRIASKVSGLIVGTGIIVIGVMFVMTSVAWGEESSRQVQVVTERLNQEELHTYTLPNLHQGDTLYMSLEGLSGNLAPVVAVADDQFDVVAFENTFIENIVPHLESGQDFLVVFPEFADNAFLAWSHTGDEWNKVTLTFPIPSTFRLLIGENAPEVVTGTAQPTGRPLIHPPIEVQVGIQVDQITEINQREENFSMVASLLMRCTKDYGRRVDVSTANLLTFVAFNFTIGSDLPRLGRGG